jgi:hypothetical protein
MKRIRIIGAVVLSLGAGAAAVGMVLAPGHDLKEFEQAYEKELRAAQEQTAASRSVLEKNGARLHEIWYEASEAASPDERKKLRPEFERLIRERSRLEIEIATLQVNVAELGLKVATERLVQARVSLREAQIKQHRRERWLEGDRDNWHRRGWPGHPPTRPADEPAADEQNTPRNEPAVHTD